MRISDWSSDVCSSDLHGFGRLDRIGRALEGGEFADEVQDRGHIVGCGGADRQRHGTIGSASAKARGLRRAAATQPAMISAPPALVHSETISPQHVLPKNAAHRNEVHSGGSM